MKPKFLLPAIVLLLLLGTTASAQSDTIKRYTKVPAGYLMVLRQNDDVFKELEKLVMQEHIPAATLTGMGFVSSTFGFFNRQTKQYDPKEFKDRELASMIGSIAWQDGKPSLHIHGLVTGKDFSAAGGHMLAAIVETGSVEIMITVHDRQLTRVMEEPLGANVLHLD